MSLNNLLLWMSARQTGSMAQFRGAAERLGLGEPSLRGEFEKSGGDFSPYQIAQFNLQSLAHAEFNFSLVGADWKMVPPVLAIHKWVDDWVGVLCGTRPPNLCEKMANPNAGVRLEISEIENMPDRVRLISGDRKALEKVARSQGLAAQLDAPATLISAIPEVGDARAWEKTKVPQGRGWQFQKFDPRTRKWADEATDGGRSWSRKDVLAGSTSLFRAKMKHATRHLLSWNGTVFQVQPRIGKYAVLRAAGIRSIMNFDVVRSMLSFPFAYRPPVLVERALVLYSGRIPSEDRTNGRLEYECSKNLARNVAACLRQEVRTQ